ncbi:MAG TPA: hypothetical protein PK669_12380 [Methanosarcina thermophila]|uniref:Expressed protein n=1 Tax=Methanosarcina thermophila TaxID=2210 RepID=A0A3G9CTL8_METTE|nr:hypothetical protein [Methanosarcina thermophila]BAW28061.1 expressed protein [Methanosarcina thermophila]HOA69928.1 hypothetical protein [Methanosarcina thermophila]HPZ21083.1 hypothetical protein [Methanosarcina thermophila]HQD95469.1 hypothetical protein [Methanosarcina thermophila]
MDTPGHSAYLVLSQKTALIGHVRAPTGKNHVANGRSTPGKAKKRKLEPAIRYDTDSKINKNKKNKGIVER